MVQGNYERHTKHEIKKAVKARKLQAMMGYTPQRDFEGMARHGMIKIALSQ